MRFGARIVLEVVDNHFVAMINDRLYDVTGDVTDDYAGRDTLVAWDHMFEYDAEQYRRIVRDCVLKLPAG